MKKNTSLLMTFRAWPVIFVITISLSLLTQSAAKLFGIDLPEQANIDLVRGYMGWNRTFVFLVVQIVVLLPVIEEILFRCCLFRLPLWRWWGEQMRRPYILVAIISSALFSFAHYIDYAAWFTTGEYTMRALDNAFLALFFFGMAQCWLYRRLGRLSSPILNHVLFNMTNLILLSLIPA